MEVHLEAVGDVVAAPLGVDRAHHALGPELRGDLADQLGALDRRRVDADLVGAGTEHPAGVLQRADPTADRERDVDLLGDTEHHVDGGLAIVGRRGDVEEHQLVGTLGVVPGGELDRVAGVTEIDEVGALHHTAAGHVEARDHPGDLHQATSSAPTASATVNRPS